MFFIFVTYTFPADSDLNVPKVSKSEPCYGTPEEFSVA